MAGNPKNLLKDDVTNSASVKPLYNTDGQELLQLTRETMHLGQIGKKWPICSPKCTSLDSGALLFLEG